MVDIDDNLKTDNGWTSNAIGVPWLEQIFNIHSQPCQ